MTEEYMSLAFQSKPVYAVLANLDIFSKTKKNVYLLFFIYIYHMLDVIFVCCSVIITAYQIRKGVMVFNATFNDISIISWRSGSLVEETGENHRPVASN